MGKAYKIRHIEQMKICGLYFCNDPVVDYDHNILSKVERLEFQLKKWMCRNLTLETTKHLLWDCPFSQIA
jgi:hypothetical protein